MVKQLPWLFKPYPLLELNKHKLLVISGFSLFTYLFLLIYEPFAVAEVELSRSLFLLGFGVAVFTGLSISYLVLPAVFPTVFKASQWLVWKEIIFIAFAFVLIALLNFLYNSAWSAEFVPQVSFWGFLGKTLAVGMFPLLAMVFLVERYRANRHKQEAQQIASSWDRGLATAEPASLTVVPETQKTAPLELDLDQFLFAEADNNYTTFYYRQADATTKQLMRVSIKNAEKQLSEIDEIIRCHRSYLVNKRQIVNVSGNARSLQVELNHYDKAIPVSRSFSRKALLPIA